VRPPPGAPGGGAAPPPPATAAPDMTFPDMRSFAGAVLG
jgi:hypothetical protein